MVFGGRHTTQSNLGKRTCIDSTQNSIIIPYYGALISSVELNFRCFRGLSGVRENYSTKNLYIRPYGHARVEMEL